jgi:hypothetical protein
MKELLFYTNIQQSDTDGLIQIGYRDSDGERFTIIKEN